jgi:hypothetical protein
MNGKNELSRVIVASDVHGNWGRLNEMIARERPGIVLQCGDFGWWPHVHNLPFLSGDGTPWDQFGVRTGGAVVYWADGNHENHADLARRIEDHGRVPIEVMPRVFYMPRGSVLELPDGRRVLFVGGADSIDRHYRVPGLSWWPEELITQADLDALPDVPVDIVISHTVPEYFLRRAPFDAIPDPSRKALDLVFDRYRPRLWFAGHFHKYIHGLHEGCRWTILHTCEQDSEPWYTDLETYD